MSKIFRKGIEGLYNLVKPAVFRFTREDPEDAHEMFVKFCKTLYKIDLNQRIFSEENCIPECRYVLSSAAGFNKNADIPLSVLKYFGFDRVVIGTVTHDEWIGNARPRMVRYPETKSLVNWMGLPGIGAKRVAENLYSYGDHKIPLTVSVMSTPNKKGDNALRDLESTILETRDVPYVNRFELNISCPNSDEILHEKSREEFNSNLRDLVLVVNMNKKDFQEIYIKISPDINKFVVKDISQICDPFVTGYTVSNTTMNHDPRYIKSSLERGGASGDAVYLKSLRVQRWLGSVTYSNKKIIAVGGISNPKRVRERCTISDNTNEVQIFTPFIFQGPKLLRRIKETFPIN